MPESFDLDMLAKDLQPLADALRANRWRLCTAESCTGGLIAAACTALPGSSEWFDRGFVTYSNEAKVGLLGVTRELIDQYGAVSQPVAEAMARGALARSEAQLSVAVTGVAGPTGGSVEKPVGLVWMAVAVAASNGLVRPQSFRDVHPGTRAEIRSATVRVALLRLLQAAQGGAGSA